MPTSRPVGFHTQRLGREAEPRHGRSAPLHAVALGICLAVAIATVACGGVEPADDAAPPGDDAGVIDAPPAVIDAPPGTADAMVEAPSPGTEVITGSGRMEGATYQMDVTIGHPASQKKIGGGGRTLEGGTPIKP
jgi:hypothetical protein